jgi:heptosyltransferase III
VILAIPALRALRRRWPGESLALAAQPRIGRLLTALGVVDRWIDFDALGLDALFVSDDDVVDPAGRRGWPERCADDLRRAARIVAWVGSRDPGFVSRLTMLSPGAIVAPSVGGTGPVWRHLLGTVGAPDESNELRSPVAVPVPLVEAARAALELAGWDGRTPLLLVHPGAGGVGKRWPAAGFASVLARLPVGIREHVVVLHRGPADSEAVDQVAALLSRRAIVLEEPELTLLTGALSQAHAYLGNDSGISHLAAAVGAPSVVLFTTDRAIWEPWARHVEPLVVSTTSVDEHDVARAIRALG